VHLLGDLVDHFKFIEALDVESMNVCTQCQVDLLVGLARAIEGDLLGREACSECDEKFTSTHNVCSRSLGSKQLHYFDIRIRFRGI
jgi:hypothetical protein